jgi:hypothetical protein
MTRVMTCTQSLFPEDLQARDHPAIHKDTEEFSKSPSVARVRIPPSPQDGPHGGAQLGSASERRAHESDGLERLLQHERCHRPRRPASPTRRQNRQRSARRPPAAGTRPELPTAQVNPERGFRAPGSRSRTAATSRWQSAHRQGAAEVEGARPPRAKGRERSALARRELGQLGRLLSGRRGNLTPGSNPALSASQGCQHRGARSRDTGRFRMARGSAGDGWWIGSLSRCLQQGIWMVPLFNRRARQSVLVFVGGATALVRRRMRLTGVRASGSVGRGASAPSLPGGHGRR